MPDLIAHLVLQARIIRLQQKEENVAVVGGFTYCVEGPEVICYRPNGSAYVVQSGFECQEALNPYQKALLLQNRMACIRSI